MKFLRFSTVLLYGSFIVFLSGCATHYGARPPLYKLAYDMDRVEVINIMGDPGQSETFSGKEGLLYSWDDPMDGGVGASEEYYVVLVDGKLKQYGVLTKGGAATLGLPRAIEQAPTSAFPEKIK